MTFLDLIIEIIGTIAGWTAIIFGLAWAFSYFSRREIYIIHVGGDNGGDGGGSGHHPEPRFPDGMKKTQKTPPQTLNAQSWRFRSRSAFKRKLY
ncbi:MAG: hypothetical protein ACOYCD_05870 [Kiritimatiellia bacterium]|jgi:hypothetical protein